MAEQAILYDFRNMVFKNCWLQVANKIPLSTQSFPLLELKFLVKKAHFFTITKLCIPGYYTGNMLFAVPKNKYVENHMKLVLKTSTF